MKRKQLYSLRLEQHVIAGILTNNDVYNQVCQFLNAEDFGDPTSANATLYSIIGTALNNSEPIDPVLISQKTKALNISFQDGLNVFDYLQSLSMRKVSREACIKAAQQVKKLSVMRTLIANFRKIEDGLHEMDDEASFEEIVSFSDKIYNSNLQLYFNRESAPKNIFEDMEENIELLGENPSEEVGMMTHLPRVNEMYGSLLREGNITVIVSRYGVGKSTLALDICSRAGIKYDVPVLHFDNGEMSYEETQGRMVASMAGVPLHLIESGLWRKSKAATNKVRNIWPKIKAWKFYYHNVGGMHYEEMINLARRWYYAEVKRGNKMIWSFDYLKLLSVGGDSDRFWAKIGIMLDEMKTFIQREIVFNDKPQIALLTSVQANRLGISRGRDSAQVEDSEGVVALSDMIGQIASHLFLLRKKTVDEIIEEGEHFGTHKLKQIKSRHLGKNPSRAMDLVCMPDGSKKENFINLEFDNFKIEERGDLIDWVNHLDIENPTPIQDGE